MTSSNEMPHWIELAEQASKETDPRKLSVLIEQLCAAIDRKSEPRIDIDDRAPE